LFQVDVSLVARDVFSGRDASILHLINDSLRSVIDSFARLLRIFFLVSEVFKANKKNFCH
jgi:hypothetical protein